MFTLENFNKALKESKFAEAKRLLDQLLADKTGIKFVDTQSKTTVLHVIAMSQDLNEALKNKAPHAESIIYSALTLQHLSIQEQTTKRTPLHIAVHADYREIANHMMTFIEKLSFALELLLIKDKQNRLPLHDAIINCNHKLVERILQQDDTLKTMYFSRDTDGLFSGALAFKQYRTNPNDLTLSLVNQLYFTLPKGPFRTKLAEEDVYMGWGFTSTPLWRYALKFCAKRDANDNITNLDLNLIDFIKQVIDDGITVWGFNVSHELMFNYSDSYSGTPGYMLREAYRTLGAGLPGRTLGQATANSTLAKHKEFMQRAKLAEENFWMKQMRDDPEKTAWAIKQLQQDKDYIVLFNATLYYIPKFTNHENTRCFKIEKAALKDKDQQRYTELVTTLSNCREELRATDTHLKNILAILPLTKIGEEKSPVVNTIVGAKSLSLLFAASDPDEVELQNCLPQKQT